MSSNLRVKFDPTIISQIFAMKNKKSPFLTFEYFIVGSPSCFGRRFSLVSSFGLKSAEFGRGLGLAGDPVLQLGDLSLEVGRLLVQPGMSLT